MNKIAGIILILVAIFIPCAIAGGITTIPSQPSQLGSITSGQSFAAVDAGTGFWWDNDCGPGNMSCYGGGSTLYQVHNYDSGDYDYNYYGSASGTLFNPGPTASTPLLSGPVLATDSNQAFASAKVGTLNLYAEDQTTGNNYFAGARADAGWNETVTLSSPGQASGIWKISFLVNGSLSTTGGSGELTLEPYVNGNPLNRNTNIPAYNDFCAANKGTNNSCGTFGYFWINSNMPGGGQQDVLFDVDDYGPRDPSTVLSVNAVNQLVTFYIPYTSGQQFSLGIWAKAYAGTGYDGAYPTNTVVDFSHTMVFDGSSLMDSNGNIAANQGFTVSSGSGFNYKNAVLPEPGSLGMVALAFALAGLTVRRRRNWVGRA